MMRLARREILAGLAVAAAPMRSARAAPATDPELAQALDARGSYAERLGRLASFDPAALTSSGRIDLLTVRAALAIDIELCRLIPGGNAEGPYRVPQAGEAGIWRHAGGACAYRLLLERQLGASIDPEAAHRRFEREIARLTRRADALMREQGLRAGTVGARYRKLFADPRWHYPDSDAGRDRAVADMNRLLGAARARVPLLIGKVPPECLAVQTRRMTDAEEATGKSGYRAMPQVGRAGAYFVDLKQIARRPSWSLASVVHHELLPGHMVQGPIEAAAGPHPLRLAYLPSFGEGWAIHAEQLMAKDGAYRGDPLAELGHIHWLLFRLARGLADTGIHHRRWSVEQARAEMEACLGAPVYFAAFGLDIARIAQEPGNRAAEALAWLCLADLAETQRAPAALRELHQRVLVDGRKPMRMLGGVRA